MGLLNFKRFNGHNSVRGTEATSLVRTLRETPATKRLSRYGGGFFRPTRVLHKSLLDATLVPTV